MSLQVWLPLNGDIKNRGINGSVVTNNGATVNASGKIGKCYTFASNYMQINDVNVPTNSWSMSVWAYPTADTSNGHQYFVGMNTSTAADFLGVICIHTNKFALRIADTTYYAPTTSALNNWYHVAATYNGSQAKLYVDGSLVGTFNTKSPVVATKVFIGTRGGLAGYFAGRLNDVRVYSHVLSPLEIKELSRGLIFHYKLDDVLNCQNLIPNGYGEFGSLGWSSSSNISTTEIPSDHSEIKASYYTWNESKDFIKIYPHHSYTISAYLKTISKTSGSTYPSIKVYDADKKEIRTYNSKEGFKTDSLTALTQALNPGDTVIHVNSLANWTNSSTNHYFHVAIFGYKDSFGTVYPDLFYTADSPTFGTYADKSNLDFDNNTITLLSAYTGKARPVGTNVCQATEGSTYFYPFGAVNIATIQDWVFKTANFTPIKNTRLMAMRYMKWSTYQDVYIAGSKLIDNCMENTSITDSSGNGYKATSTGSPQFIIDSGRHINSLYTTNGVNDYVSAPIVITPTAVTMNIWIKSKDSSNGVGNYHIPFCIDGDPYEISIGSDGKLRNGFRINGTRYADTTTSKNVITDHAWHMLTATYDGTTIKRYVDGELVGTREISGTLNTTSKVWLGRYGTATTYGDKNLYKSDARFYATALSADDIKQLYQDAAYVTRNGELHSYDIFEDDTAANPMVKHTGVADAKGNLINKNMISGTNRAEYTTNVNEGTLENGIMFAGSGGNGTFSITKETVPCGQYSYNIVGNTSGNRDFQQNHIEYKSGQTYIASWWAKGSGTCQFRVWNRTSSSQVLAYTVALTSNWAFYTYSFAGTSVMETNDCTFHLGVTGSAEIHICGMKLEQASKPTAWCYNEYDKNYNGNQHGFIERNEVDSLASVDIHRGYFEAKEFIEM